MKLWQCPEKQGGNSRFGPESKRNGSELENKSKRKRNRRKERKRNKIKNGTLKIYDVNAAGVMSKIHSFENNLRDENPSVFCIQETKLRKPNQIKTETAKN